MSKFGFFFQFILFLFIGSTSLAQETTVREFPMEDRALLWKIEGNGIKTKSYLFGTVHLIDKELFFFPKKLEKIVSKSDLLTMEIAGIPDMASSMELMMLKEGSFFDFFTDEQTDSLLTWISEHTSLSEKSFRMMAGKMHPFVVSQMLTEMDESNPNRGMENKKSYEVELQAIADDKKIEIQGFETAAEQMGFFSAFSDEQQVDMVMAIVRDTSSFNLDETAKITQLYTDQNIDGLYQLIADEGDVLDGMNEILLDNRNKRWIPMIEKMIAEKSTFIAVGAGHLGGPNGVIRLLEAQGYTLTPIEL